MSAELEIKTFEIWHRDFPIFYPAVRDEELGWPQRHTLVAKIHTTDLDMAYGLTQHIERPWWHNGSVDLIQESRSTSIGDVIVDTVSGVAYSVEMVGFAQVAEIHLRETQPE
jgi:hypothetical protein